MSAFIKSRSLHRSPLAYSGAGRRNGHGCMDPSLEEKLNKPITMCKIVSVSLDPVPANVTRPANFHGHSGGSELPNPEHPLEVPERSATDTATFGGSAAISLHGVNAHHDVAITHSVFNDLTCRRVYMRIRTWPFPILYTRGRESYSIGTALRHATRPNPEARFATQREVRARSRHTDLTVAVVWETAGEGQTRDRGYVLGEYGVVITVSHGPASRSNGFQCEECEVVIVVERERAERHWQLVNEFSQCAPSGMELVKFHARRELMSS
ncbi:hypothetical protein FB451DRAFT_1182554 [Mycena latifolia]|nr:hypothetical protein FB451DRAFT_1182554 [Mycena latifolia]